MAHNINSCGSWALENRLNSFCAQAELFHNMWNFPGSGIKSVSPALASVFFTTEPPAKPSLLFSDCPSLVSTLLHWLTIVLVCPLKLRKVMKTYFLHIRNRGYRRSSTWSCSILIWLAQNFVTGYLITVLLEMKLIKSLPKYYLIYISRKIASQVNISLSWIIKTRSHGPWVNSQS